MKEKKDGAQVNIWMEKALLARVDKLAKKAKVSRSRLVENMVEMTTKSLERADAFGVLSIAILFRDFEEAIKAWVTEVREDHENLKDYYENGGGVEAIQ
jgi:metal-responsive CopG/Arc/MetJ family transcriptional regulator